MQIEGLDYLQKPQIQSRIEQIKSSQDDKSQLLAIMALFKEIQKASKSIVDEIGAGVAISNLDEVTTAIHNETAKNTRLLLTALKDMKLSADKQATVLAEISKESQNRLDEEFQTIKIRRPLDKVTVTNFSDLPVAEEIRVNNLSEVLLGLKQLENVIERSLNIKIDAPQVTINPPEVNVSVPAQNITFPDFETEAIVAALSMGLKKIRTNNSSNPMFFRMTELDRLLDKLEEIHQASRNVMLGFPGSVALRDVSGGIADPSTFGAGVSLIANTLGDGSKNVTSAGTRVQLSTTSIPCKWVIITAKVGNTGTIYIGGITIATGRGKPLVNLQEIMIDINDVSKVWMDADTSSDGVTFCYGS